MQDYNTVALAQPVTSNFKATKVEEFQLNTPQILLPFSTQYLAHQMLLSDFRHGITTASGIYRWLPLNC